MKYHISSNNKLEIKDCTGKLITAFAFKRFLYDYRRKKAGVDVKRIKSINIRHKSLDLTCPLNIAEHRVDINETGVVPPPFSEDVEHRLRNLVSFDEAPWLSTLK